MFDEDLNEKRRGMSVLERIEQALAELRELQPQRNFKLVNGQIKEVRNREKSIK